MRKVHGAQKKTPRIRRLCCKRAQPAYGSSRIAVFSGNDIWLDNPRARIRMARLTRRKSGSGKRNLRLDDITASTVNAAIDIYLRLAYGDAVAREEHAKRFDPETPIEDVLSTFDREDGKLKAYALRLGSQEYPHMKLVLREAFFPDEYAFVVDRHDGFAFPRNEPGYEEWLRLKEQNYRLKKEIQKAWFEAELPTMRTIKEQKLSESDLIRAVRGHLVLMVDNDPDAGAILETILRSGGYECHWVQTVAEANEALQDKRSGGRSVLALVDLLLPDGDGFDVVKAIRATPAVQDIPVILTSALQDEDVDLDCADAYLRKPYSGKQLLKAVRLMLRARYEGGENLIQ